jgi:DNA-binding transcriptional ArsR family regulator
MDAVFRALADPSRRVLLDQLFDEDGQTLVGLSAAVPALTRFGVMKHLAVLEDAGLVTTRKVGREKHHYLNPVPIQLVHDRWISKYAQPWVRGLVDLKHDLERQSATTGTKGKPWPPSTSTRSTSARRPKPSGKR